MQENIQSAESVDTAAEAFAECHADSPIIEAEQLSWRVKNKSILKELSFSVARGEFVGIIGPNGAGKSSLLRCIYGKNALSTGQLKIDSKLVDTYSRQALAQKIAVVLQEPDTQFELSVLDVIRMGLTPHKSLLAFETEEDKLAILAAASKVELDDKLQQRFSSLSGGEKQRAIIARAILQNPELLLMDEPTNHLDIRHQIEMLELARRMEITVVVSIHDLNLAATFCDRLILLDKGEIVAAGPVEAVLTEERIRQVFNVNAKIDSHPFNGRLRITFDLAVGASHHSSNYQESVKRGNYVQR